MASPTNDNAVGAYGTVIKVGRTTVDYVQSAPVTTTPGPTPTPTPTPAPQPVPYVPPAGVGAIPSWVPPQGYIADVPALNTATQGAPAVYVSSGHANDWATSSHERWASGAYVSGNGDLGVSCIFGGGHEPTAGSPHMQGVVVFDYATLKYSGKCAPPQVNLEQYNINGFNGTYPDGTYYRAHVYRGLAAVPREWGTTVGGGIIHFAAPGSGYTDRSMVYDIGYDTGANISLGPEIDIGTGGVLPLHPTKGSFTYCCIDTIRQGWWMGGQSYGNYNCFVSKNGDKTYFRANPILNGDAGNDECVIFHIPERDVIIGVQGGGWQGIGRGGYFNRMTVYNPKTNTVVMTSQQVTPGQEFPCRGNSGYYTFPRQVNSFTFENNGTGYTVGDHIILDWAYGYDSRAKLVVTSVNGTGGITGATFETSLWFDYVYPERGQYQQPPNAPWPFVAGTADTADQQLLLNVIGGTGTGCVFHAHVGFTVDTNSPGGSGLNWNSIEGCAVGVTSEGACTLRPTNVNDLTQPWIWETIPLTHWAAGDPNGSPVINPARNSYYQKMHYADKLDAYVIHSQSYNKPQVFRLPANKRKPLP